MPASIKPPPPACQGRTPKQNFLLPCLIFLGARNPKIGEENFVIGVAPPKAGRGGVALLAFSKNFGKMNLGNVVDFSLKKSSRIFK